MSIILEVNIGLFNVTASLLQLNESSSFIFTLACASLLIGFSLLWLSSGFVHLIPDAWQLSEEDNAINTMLNTGIHSVFDT